MSESPPPGFRDLGLSDPILEALSAVGYESPSPIQAQTIPTLLAGSDVLGQAQTGTGKTAAFALPVLERIDTKRPAPQALVLVPTRELAIQVAEAFQKYAARLPGFHVLPIYGGQSYTPQLKGLKRGAHVIVGTPGRVMDHMKSGALQLANLSFLVLDEGDEMLQMGFVDDIEWILEQTPPERQIALFSATMPPAIRRIAQKHMRKPAEITIQNRAGTAPKIRQRYWLVSGMHKLDALTRVLEVTRFDAMLIFVRTKLETTELADRLEARGFSTAPLSGDIPQQQRERTVARLKAGQLDILVATDVAARGLDVERISHVVNYDIPYDSETYIHRIGRTGRAGRSGEAILFVAPRERNMLRVIERVTKQRLEPMTLPSVADVNEQRVLKFKERIAGAVQSGQGKAFEELIAQIEQDQNIPALEIAAALAGLLQGSTPFLLAQKAHERETNAATGGVWTHDSHAEAPAREPHSRRPRKDAPPPRESYRTDAGHVQNVRPDNTSERESPSDVGRKPARERHSQRSYEESSPTESYGTEVSDVHGAQPGSISEDLTSETDRQPAREHPTRPSDEDSFPLESYGSEGGDTRDVQPGNISEDPPSEADRKPAREHHTRRSRDDGLPMESFRIEVGHAHGVLPGNIVGAIANEAGLDGRHIGHIDIRDDHSFVDLPEGMPVEIFRSLKKVRVRGEELRISRIDSKPPRSGDRPARGMHRPDRKGTPHKDRGPSKGKRSFSTGAPKARHARKDR